jgi:hypothetical protein
MRAVGDQQEKGLGLRSEIRGDIAIMMALMEKTASETRRLREAILRGFNFLSADQEKQLREASVNTHGVPKAAIYKPDCRARKLCQENTSAELTLIPVAIEISVQDLAKEIIRTSKKGNAAPDGRGAVPGNPDGAASPFPSPATLRGDPIAETVRVKEVTNPIGIAAHLKGAGIEEAAEGDCDSLSPDQEVRVQEAAADVAYLTDVLIVGKNQSAKVLCQGSVSTGPAPFSPNIKDVVQALAVLHEKSRNREKGKEWIEDKGEAQSKES